MPSWREGSEHPPERDLHHEEEVRVCTPISTRSTPKPQASTEKEEKKGKGKNLLSG